MNEQEIAVIERDAELAEYCPEGEEGSALSQHIEKLAVHIETLVGCVRQNRDELDIWRTIGGTLQTVLEDSQAFLAQLTSKQRNALETAWNTLVEFKDASDAQGG